MPRPRSTYTAEFKPSAVKMIADQKLSVAEAARRLDVGKNLLREWRKAFLGRGDAAFPGHGALLRISLVETGVADFPAVSEHPVST